jgi:hypothetical protein
MNHRIALLAVAALAAAFGICLALCRWGDLRTVALEVQRDEELKPYLEARRRRHEAKRVLAAEVVAGRITLHEAASRFRRLDETDPSYPPGTPRALRDKRFFCTQVLDTVWEVLAHQGKFVAAACWYSEVFTSHPQVLDGPPTGHRYNAARAAVLAGCGRSRDAADLDDESRAGFRRRALDWLRAELEAQHRLLKTEPEKTSWIIASGLQRWLWDSDFAGVHEPDALGRLPEAERQAWHKLWVEVADTQARAEGTLSPKQRARSKIPRPER